jgi:hypothetical protein
MNVGKGVARHLQLLSDCGLNFALQYLPLRGVYYFMMKVCLSFLVACAALCLTACRKTPDAQIAKGARHLGVHITPAQNQDYPAAFAQARTAGIDCVPFTMQWSALEVSGTFDPQGLLNDLNGFYGRQPISLSLCLSPIFANRRDLPTDLMQMAFDDSVMIHRFERLLDTVHAHLSSTNISYLLIGNEVDLYFSLYPDEWSAYTTFCAAVRTHARSLWGTQLLVGAETTLGANLRSDYPAIANLNASLDMVCLTYYPLSSSFKMNPVSVVGNDFESLLQKYPGRKVLMQECGYATSPLCSGSDSAQASFVRDVFTIWDRHTEQMIYVAFLWLNDLSHTQAQSETVDYGLNGTTVDQTFTAYIGSLGLCDSLGVAKAGFLALKQEAEKRGWKP